MLTPMLFWSVSSAGIGAIVTSSHERREQLLFSMAPRTNPMTVSLARPSVQPAPGQTRPCFQSVASGSSCVSKSLKISHVLHAIGLDPALAQGSLILSLGQDNTLEEIDYVVETFGKIVTKLRGLSPRWAEFEKGLIDSVISPKGRNKSFRRRAAKVSGKSVH